MHDETRTQPDLSRRVLLRGAALGGIAVPLLAACGSDADSAGSGAPAASSPESSPSASAPSSGSSSAAPSGGTTVAAADVPVGGGTVLADEKLVVTQPSKGEYKAFSAVCTHQGCTVQTISDGKINCPCHGSAFAIEDGSVVNGPAARPLEARDVSVEGDSLTVA